MLHELTTAGKEPTEEDKAVGALLEGATVEHTGGDWQMLKEAGSSGRSFFWNTKLGVGRRRPPIAWAYYGGTPPTLEFGVIRPDCCSRVAAAFQAGLRVGAAEGAC